MSNNYYHTPRLIIIWVLWRENLPLPQRKFNKLYLNFGASLFHEILVHSAPASSNLSDKSVQPHRLAARALAPCKKQKKVICEV